MSLYLFTSESVAEGHPDKLCDQISDAILDEILKQDPHARVACETFATSGLVLVAGEITTKARVDYNKITRQTIREIGYDRPDYGFDAETCGVLISIHEQSPDIAQAVSKSQSADKYESLGAGDQGIMYGYACKETPELMPLPIVLAHGLVKRLAHLRHEKKLSYLGPDGKSQVTIAYDEKGHPLRAHTVVLSAQHAPDVTQKELERDLTEHIVKPVLERWLDPETQILINPSGRFVVGGPCGDTGMTGRKIEVDTYGGYGSHGGGAFSGKDPTKVDRSASYYARYVAKNIVAAGLASECEVQVAYAIGKPRPLAITVDTFGSGKLPNGDLAKLIHEHFDFRPAAIIEQLDLRRPIYRCLAAYGHFGRPELNLPWEKTDRAEALRNAR
ncbi:MAG: methionine adenosyltransferase [Candidatus Bipolaricaulota bacterium]|nr:methionine adenosyltransferase [Candidatus Bipolaricaulota bacterium]MDW8141254.1 methionine adenosyltransferase [Candidatus Bipolaricaulota bacterium]